MDELLLKNKKKNTKTALISFDADLLKRIDDYADSRGLTRTRFVEIVCADALKSLERKVK